MAYKMCWSYGKHEIFPLRTEEGLSNQYTDTGYVFTFEWKPCYARLGYQKNQTYLTVWLCCQDDYTKEFKNSPAFLRIYRYWIAIGKQIGLNFNDIEFNYNKEQDVMRVIYNIGYLKKYPALLRTRILWLHLFFLRLLQERRITVFNLLRYRNRLLKQGINLLQALIICEISTKDKRKYQTGEYWAGGHHLFKELCVDQYVAAGNETSIVASYIKNCPNNNPSMFDNSLFAYDNNISGYRYQGYLMDFCNQPVLKSHEYYLRIYKRLLNEKQTKTTDF
jgi:hypothetical protein